jgi:hypothetical protein
MFEKIGTSIYYKGVYLEDHPVVEDLFVGGYLLPEEYLHEINAKDLPDVEYDEVYYLLPNAKSIISSKTENNAIIIMDVTETGVLLSIHISANDNWDEPLSPNMFFSEIKAIFDEMHNIELHNYHLNFEFSSYYELNYHLLVPSFNLKVVYDVVNNLLMKVENTVYKKMIKMAIDKL